MHHKLKRSNTWAFITHFIWFSLHVFFYTGVIKILSISLSLPSFPSPSHLTPPLCPLSQPMRLSSTILLACCLPGLVNCFLYENSVTCICSGFHWSLQYKSMSAQSQTDESYVCMYIFFLIFFSDAHLPVLFWHIPVTVMLHCYLYMTIKLETWTMPLKWYVTQHCPKTAGMCFFIVSALLSSVICSIHPSCSVWLSYLLTVEYVKA